jgi:putative spermidine/putrescine transport system permease protein
LAARRILRVYTYVLFVVMLAPILIVLPVALTRTNYMTFPPEGITGKWFLEGLRDQILLDALGRSLVLAVATAVFSVALALLASFAVERRAFAGRRALETFFTGPRVIPQIILVLGLLIFFRSLNMGGSFTGLLLAHFVVTFPFAFRTILASVSSVDVILEWSARTLGANWLTVFRRVLIPQIKTALIAAFMFSFIESFNNVTIALFLSRPGARTLPVELFVRLQVGGITPSVPALSFLLAGVAIALFVILDRTIGIYKFLAGSEGSR